MSFDLCNVSYMSINMENIYSYIEKVTFFSSYSVSDKCVRLS